MAERFQILVCDGPSCGVTHESETLVRCMRQALVADPELGARVELRDYTCFGRCDDGPNLFVRRLGPGEGGDEPDPAVFEAERAFYPGMSEAKVLRVLHEHCRTGVAIAELVDDY